MMAEEHREPSTSLSQTRKSSDETEEVQRLTGTLVALPANFEQSLLDVLDKFQLRVSVIRDQPPINWWPYVEAGFISQDNYDFINAFQYATTKKQRDELLQQFKDTSLQSLMEVVPRVSVVEDIQKFLILIDDMLWEDIERVKLFNPNKTEPWRAFLDLLSCADEFVRNISSHIIVVLISHEGSKPQLSDILFFLGWLKGELRWDNTYLSSVAQCLQLLMKINEYRVHFFNNHGIFKITRLLGENIKVQVQYQLVFCLWMASFNQEVVEKMNRYTTISVLTQLLENAPNEIIKLPRIILATFRNLLEKPREEGVWQHNALLMVQYKVLNCIQILKRRQAARTDPEHMENIEIVEAILEKYVKKLSSFDEYRLEVMSGLLEWSVVHTSKTFWIENGHRLSENDYELVRILVLLLQEEGQDSVVLCVALHDLGEYMNQCKREKKEVVKLGGKDAMLNLLKHCHPMVKFYALKALQILMLNSYDLLSEYVCESSETARSYHKRYRDHNKMFGI